MYESASGKAAARTIVSAASKTFRIDFSDLMQALSQYEFLADALRWVQTFERKGILHVRVQSEPPKVSLFTGIISDIDSR